MRIEFPRRASKSEDPYRLVRVQHGLRPRLALVACAADRLRAALLVLACLRTLVADSRPVVHLVERELLDELCPGVRRGLGLLDILLAVALIMQHLRNKER